MKFKRTIGFLLTICLMVGLLPISAVQTFAATEIKSIVLTGDITPVQDKAMCFATAPSNANYTVIQAWYNADDGKGFTDSDEYNNMLDEESLLSEAERKFEESKTYHFCVLVIPQSADVQFASNMTVSITPYGNIPFLGALGNGMVAYQLDFNIGIGGHIHVRENQYRYNDESHWYRCTQDDGFIFDDKRGPHTMDATTGVCTECGYVATDDDATKLVSQPETSITVDCGDTIELTVKAEGRNLKYSWQYTSSGSKVSFSNGENYSGYGFNISGSDTATLKIENCNQKLEWKLPIVCRVTGMWGEVETAEINVTVNHRSEVYVSVDENGHKVQCTCGKVMASSEAHTYNSDNICEKCGYEKGTARTRFQGATLELPNFSDKDTVKKAKETATLSGVGIKEGTGIKEIQFITSGTSVSDDTVFGSEKGYGINIYPDLEDNFYMGEGSFLTYITYKGIVKRSYTKVDEDGRCFLSVSLGEPYIKKVAEFSSNGGSGHQAVIYADEHDSIYFPVCSFSKTNDEFYAWEYNGKLYAEDPNEEVPVYIKEEYAQVKAVWRSELTNNVELTMDYPKNGDKVSDVGFYVPMLEESYSVVGATWYEDNYQEITGNDLGLELGENETLDKTKNYNVRIAVTGKGFASNDILKLSLNNQSIADIKRHGLQTISFVLQIRGGTNISLTEPTEDIALDLPSEITVNNNIMSVDESKTYWSHNDNESGKYAASSIAVLNEQYYLSCWLTYSAGVKNTILFGNTVLVNGTEYTIKKIGDGYIRVVVPFTAQKLHVTVSEDLGLVYIKSPKAMNVTLAVALYDSNKTLKRMIWNKELALTKGENEINFMTLDSVNGPYMILRKNSDSVKVMVFESADTLKALSSAHVYRYRQK